MIQQRVLVFPLVFKELVQPVSLEDALWLVREEDGVTVKGHPQLGLWHLRRLLWHEHGGCCDAWIQTETSIWATDLKVEIGPPQHVLYFRNPVKPKSKEHFSCHFIILQINPALQQLHQITYWSEVHNQWVPKWVYDSYKCNIQRVNEPIRVWVRRNFPCGPLESAVWPTAAQLITNPIKRRQVNTAKLIIQIMLSSSWALRRRNYQQIVAAFPFQVNQIILPGKMKSEIWKHYWCRLM